MTYELVYGGGGHGGPWPTLDAAKDGAERFLRGCRIEWVVYVVPRDGRNLDARNAVLTVRRSDLTPP